MQNFQPDKQFRMNLNCLENEKWRPVISKSQFKNHKYAMKFFFFGNIDDIKNIKKWAYVITQMRFVNQQEEEHKQMCDLTWMFKQYISVNVASYFSSFEFYP